MTLRYATVLQDNGLARVVRSDGAPLASGGAMLPTAPPAAPPAAPALDLEALRAEWRRYTAAAIERAANPPRRGRGQPAGPPAPAGTPLPNGAALRARREALGLSQYTLAAVAGLSRSGVATAEQTPRRMGRTRLTLDATLGRLEQERRGRRHERRAG